MTLTAGLGPVRTTLIVHVAWLSTLDCKDQLSCKNTWSAHERPFSLWVFGCWSGHRFGDNAGAVHDSLTENIRIAGFARHDHIFDAPVPDRTSIPTVGERIPNDRAVFVSLPTFREGMSRQSFDFILLERPIVYYVPDMQSFTNHRPLMCQLEEVAVGPLCTSEDELAGALTAARLDGIGDHRDRYDEPRRRFHTYPPGGASTRLVDAIEQEFLGVVGDVRAPQLVG
jgi:hypothetical protein